MKKIVCISLCVLLCVPLLALSAFAETTVEGVFSTSFSTVYLIQITVDSFGDGSSSDPHIVSLPVGRPVKVAARGQADGYTPVVFVVKYNGVSLSTDPNNPTVIPYSSSISFSCTSTGGANGYYVFIENPAPLDELGVSDGVSAFIGFGGDVLHFITNNSAILTLVGLSVGLCLVIPFGISKIKDLLKGY